MRSSRKSRRRATPRPNGARDLFEGRFSEVLIIFVLALIVLGPEKLPRVVSEVGRWVGRARSMARQFREQLEEEVQLEEARKAQRAAASAAAPSAAAPATPSASASDGDTSGGVASAAEGWPPPLDPAPAEPPVVRPPTYSHSHPTDATGADPTAPRPSHAPSADERGT